MCFSNVARASCPCSWARCPCHDGAACKTGAPARPRCRGSGSRFHSDCIRVWMLTVTARGPAAAKALADKRAGSQPAKQMNFVVARRGEPGAVPDRRQGHRAAPSLPGQRPGLQQILNPYARSAPWPTTNPEPIAEAAVLWHGHPARVHGQDAHATMGLH